VIPSKYVGPALPFPEEPFPSIHFEELRREATTEPHLSILVHEHLHDSLIWLCPIPGRSIHGFSKVHWNPCRERVLFEATLPSLVFGSLSLCGPTKNGVGVAERSDDLYYPLFL